MSDRDPAAPLILVVTCASAPAARRESAARQLAQHFPGHQAEFVEGFVGTDPEIAGLYDPTTNRRRSKRPLTPAEIAVYAGHRKAMQRLLSSGSECALIFEDDFRIDAPNVVSAAAAGASRLLSQGRNVIKLFDFPSRHEYVAKDRIVVEGIELVRWRSARAGTVAYLISRAGARGFLSRGRVFRAIDEDLKYFWELGLDVWSVPGNPVVDASDTLGGSLVDAERRSNRERNLWRSIYGNLLTIHRKWLTALKYRSKRKAQGN